MSADVEKAEKSTPLVKESTPLVTPPAKPPKLDPIEGTRGVLTILIILFHFGGTAEFNLPERNVTDIGPTEHWMRGVLFSGSEAYLGFFFTISGFVAQIGDKPLPVTLVDRAYWIALRFIRLAPAYYAAIVVYTLQVIYASIFNPYEDWHSENVGGMALFLELTMLQSWFPFQDTSVSMRGHQTADKHLNGMDWCVRSHDIPGPPASPPLQALPPPPPSPPRHLGHPRPVLLLS